MTCTVETCSRRVKAKGLCSKHYEENRATAECKAEECDKRVVAKGFCRKHYSSHPDRKRCQEAGCSKVVAARDWCQGHYIRWKKYGTVNNDVPLQVKRSKGEGAFTADGYLKVHIPNHPMATKQGYVMQHRLVMSEVIGRPLEPYETVHHINGIRHDNRPENLELWGSNHPAGQRTDDKTAWAVEWLRTHAPQLLKEP